MRMSENIKRLEVSGTMAWFARVRELVQSGRDIVSLATGELDSPTPQFIAEAGIAAIRGGQTRYTLNSGTLDLRQAIAARMQRDLAVPCEAANVLVSNGSKQALFNALYALCGPGDEVIIFSPYYPSYPSQVLMSGATPVIVPLRAENGWQISPEMLAGYLTPRTKAIIINSPANPTGAILNDDSLRAVAEAAGRSDCWIIADQIYERIVYAPQKPRSIVEVSPESRDRTVIVSGLSKSFAMTGWRIGYAVGPRPVIEGAALVQSHTTNNACSISQQAALAALTEETDFGRRLLIGLKERRDMAREAVESIPMVRCGQSEGAFYLFPDVRELLRSGRAGGSSDSTALATCLLEEHGVAVVPGAAFGTEGFLRISYAVDRGNLAEGCRRFRKGLEGRR